jgi:hypothetical protein
MSVQEREVRMFSLVIFGISWSARIFTFNGTWFVSLPFSMGVIHVYLKIPFVILSVLANIHVLPTTISVACNEAKNLAIWTVNMNIYVVEWKMPRTITGMYTYTPTFF